MTDTCRLLTVHDQHVDAVAPRSRRDDYCEAIFRKLEEIRNLAFELKVHGVLFTGDLVNRQEGPRVPYWLTNRLIDYFRAFPAGVKKYVALGNHDVRGSPADWHRQPIGAIVRSRDVTPLWEDPDPDENPLGAAYDTAWECDGKFVSVTGKLFDAGADSPSRRAAHYGVRRVGNEYVVMVCHTVLVPERPSYPGDATTPEDLAGLDSPADLYVGGHVHDDLGEFGSGRIRCVNYGALSRGTIDEYNLRRKVQVGLIEIARRDGAWHAEIRPIALKSAMPAEMVFAVDEVEKVRKRDDDLGRLGAALRAGTLRDEFRIVSPDDAMRLVVQAEGVGPEVAALVKKYVDEARQELA